MSISDQTNLPQVREFLETIAPSLPAYRHAEFTYVALVYNGASAILQARMLLLTDPPRINRAPLRTLSVLAGNVSLDIDATGVENCIRRALSNDWLPLIGEQLLKLIPSGPQYSSGYSAYFEHEEPPQASVTKDRLLISGISRSQLVGIRWREIGRELQELGYDSLEEVLSSYELRRADETALEMGGTPVATIYPTSKLSGRHVQLNFALAKVLDPARFRMIIRNADATAVNSPLSLAGTDIQWMQKGEHREGQWALELSQSAIIDCRAVYAGNVQAALRLVDRSVLPNPLRNMIGLVDPECARLEKLLTEPYKTQGRDFEAAVAWLLHLLGFAAVHLGSMSDLSGEPDILACESGGVLLIVECTTGVPSDNKLTLLISRVARMRENLRNAREAIQSGEVLAFLVCPLPPDEIVGMRRKAQSHAIIVLSRPEIDWAIERSRFAPNPAAMLASWRNLALTQFLTGSQLGQSLDG